MNEIAVGVPMFCRENALENLLDSVPAYVETVYVADNGDAEDRDCYTQDYPFSLNVLDLTFDIGIGACRHEIVQECSAEYLWIGDNDMSFTRDDDLRKLKEILKENPKLGGVSGWLLEGNNVRAGARDIHIAGDVAVKEAKNPPEMHEEPYPHARFDFIPQAGLFRTECFESYNYDPMVQSTEHLDFFLGQKEADEWDFASTPAVVIQHHRNIDEDYRNSRRGTDHTDEEILQEKWDIATTEPGAMTDWGYHRGKTPAAQAFDAIKRVSPPKVWLPLKRAAEGVGLQ